jgi:hypothetical protein
MGWMTDRYDEWAQQVDTSGQLLPPKLTSDATSAACDQVRDTPQPLPQPDAGKAYTHDDAMRDLGALDGFVCGVLSDYGNSDFYCRLAAYIERLEKSREFLARGLGGEDWYEVRWRPPSSCRSARRYRPKVQPPALASDRKTEGKPKP